MTSWPADFNDTELRAFDAAIRTWKRYSELMERYRRDPVGRATVLKVYEEYTHNATALADSYVRNYVEGGVRQLSAPTPLSWTARMIELNDKGSLIEFDQCTDYTTLDLQRDGKPVEDTKPENDHAILRVQMASDAEGTWRQLSTELVDEPCE